MFSCPKCSEQLVPQRTDHGPFFECPRCGGCTVSWVVVRRVLREEYAKRFWQQARREQDTAGMTCPACRNRMRRVHLPLGNQELELDVCLSCQLLWLDRHQLEQLPRRRPIHADIRELPEKAREQIALAQLRLAKKRAAGGDFGEEAPEELWKWIPALLGMPVEYDVPPVRSWPWVTWAIALSLVATALVTRNDVLAAALQWGFIPADPLRHGGLTLITSFFLHIGLWHMIGNAYFLLLFGDNVEDRLGHGRFVCLLAAATLAGALFHWLGEPQCDMPCIGASGGIAGILVYYALLFPRARLGIMIRLWFVFRWCYFPAYFGLILWVLLQVLGAYFQVQGLSNVSFLGHLGGAGAGLIAWLVWRAPQTEVHGSEAAAIGR